MRRQLTVAFDSAPVGMPEQMQEQARWFPSAFDDAPVPMAVLSPAGELRAVNHAWCDLVGWPADRLLRVRVQTLVVPEDQQAAEADRRSMLSSGAAPVHAERVLLRADRQPVPVRVDARVVTGPDGQASHVVCVLHDVSAQRAELLALAHQTLHDPLTGLPNRVLFLDRLTHALDRQQRRRVPVAVLYCDLDGFKAVNDRYGHAAGDLALVEFAQRLCAVQRPGDTAARLAGDEFAVLCEDAGLTEARSVADRLRAVMREPIALGDATVSLSASIGVAAAGPASVRAADLLQQADRAMYRVKHRLR